MRATDGRDLMFAGAGIVWGVVTVFRGLQEWRQGTKRIHQTACAVGTMPLAKTDFPAMIIPGAALAIGCGAYLVWSIWSL